MTSTTLDDELTLLEEFEFDRPCTPWVIKCGVKAEWLLITTCCGVEIPLCSPHHDECVAEQLPLSLFTLLVCGACDFTFPIGSQWDAGYRWEKL